MSTTPTSNASAPHEIATDTVSDVTPIVVSASSLDSTAPDYLRDVKAELVGDGYHPTVLTVDACFGEDCPLATQDVADELRAYVRAASFLGTARVEVTVDEAADEAAVRTALRALEERAHREGVAFSVSGAISA
ncbi:hypothetical protein [Halogeometricum limi]|uniref:DUF7961 domain-containing protein n=1 Tax=Halogeometricum limi TaxID=555875 RepID=A0A1I6GHS6_9EURY|nr:hypothetical protein [Halogeometricum limi]SFR41699.1 hypothetical protein SAMN04488124_1059 [Halogeometricum limi]